MFGFLLFGLNVSEEDCRSSNFLFSSTASNSPFKILAISINCETSQKQKLGYKERGRQKMRTTNLKLKRTLKFKEKLDTWNFCHVSFKLMLLKLFRKNISDFNFCAFFEKRLFILTFVRGTNYTNKFLKFSISSSSSVLRFGTLCCLYEER